MAKDFSQLNTSRAMLQMQTAQGLQETEEQLTQEVQEVQDKQEKQRKPRKRYTPEQAQDLLESGRNGRGLGGVKMSRINMAFTPVNYDFIKTLATMRGQTYTDFVNHLIDISREKYQEQYAAAKKLKNSF
jgi:hypothetical protein